MSAQLLKGKPVADALAVGISADVAALAGASICPTLAIVRVGERPDDLAYERGIVRKCQALGVAAEVTALPPDTGEDEYVALIRAMSENRDIHGILPFRPLPAGIGMAAVRAAIDPEKDIDCLSPGSSASVFDRTLPGFLPCTAEAAAEILLHYKVPLAGARAVILGRSLVVGRALSLMLMDLDCTVTVCHSKTRDIAAVASEGDILVSAMGRARMVTASFVKKGAVVIDVGINDDGQGGICGDVDFNGVEPVAGAISPVPGGIGMVTNTILVRNVVTACGRMLGLK